MPNAVFDLLRETRLVDLTFDRFLATISVSINRNGAIAYFKGFMAYYHGSQFEIYGGNIMEAKCENCGGELVEGQMAGMHGIFFYPEGEINKFRPKRSSVVCYCCKSCGTVQKFRVKEIDKLF